MVMQILETTPVPVAIYFNNGNNVITQPKASDIRSEASNITNKYLPILSLINVQDDSLVFQNVNYYDDKITINNRSKDISLYGKMPVTASDLIMNSVNFVVNLSDTTILIRDSYNIPKMFEPVAFPKITESNKGNVLIFTVHYLSSISFIKAKYNLDNYISFLNDSYSSSTNPMLAEMKIVAKYVIDFFNKNNIEEVVVNSSSTIKVVTVTRINMDIINNTSDTHSGKISNFNLPNKNVVLSIGSFIKAKEHPALIVNYKLTEEVFDKLKSGIVKIFIVDKDDKISDRYLSLAGKTIRVPKVKKVELKDGLYLINGSDSDNIHDNTRVADNNFITDLDTIDTVKYLYKTREEAETGANKIQAYRDNLELDRLAALNEIEESKTKLLILRDAFEKEKLEFATNVEKTNKELDLYKMNLEKEAAERKNLFEELSIKRKDYFEHIGAHRRDNYESMKYERDTTVETLKTVAAVAGVIATGYVIYKKLN